MLALSYDATEIAVLDTIPVIPVPASGDSPALRELFRRPSCNAYLAGRDGLHAMVRTPWLDALIPVSKALPMARGYGVAGPARLDLLCGLLPGRLLDDATDQFIRKLPDEDACFILWNAGQDDFRLLPAEVTRASPSRLEYRPPRIEPGWHLVADIHSHGYARPFWSPVDDADDENHTALSIVIGNLHHPGDEDAVPGQYVARLCSNGLLFPLGKRPATPTVRTVFVPSAP